MSRNNGLDQRDAKSGRFLTGNNGGGRKVGSRNRLGEQFVADLHESWLANGKSVIAKVIETDPAQYLRTIARILPQELSAEIDVNVSLFHEIDNVNQAYRIAMDYLHGRIKADDEPVLIEASNGGE
jgi:hypothetical protein